MWAIGIHRYGIRLPWQFFGKVSAISIVASFAAYSVVVRLSPLWGLIAGTIAALIVFFVLAYAFKILEPEDSSRFKMLSAVAPRALAGPLNRAFDLLTKRTEPDSMAV
jgi:hypothetical protein